MAGDWIKMRTHLDTDPRVLDIAAALDVDELHVIGMLWKIWSWADTHTTDGSDMAINEATIDRFVHKQGFAAVLRKVGWLTGRDRALVFTRFAEHNGQTAKERCNNQLRVAKHRSNKKSLQVKQNIPAHVRRHVVERDNNCCVYCGRKHRQTFPMETKDQGNLVFDHVIPESRGGATSAENLVLSCKKCNMHKANRTPDECGLPWPEDETGKRYGCNEKTLPEKRREEKNKEKQEKESGSAKASPGVRVLFSLPTKDGDAWGMTEAWWGEQRGAFPKLESARAVRGELEKMRAWLEANPERKKTKRGMGKFVNSWLARAEERMPQVTEQSQPAVTISQMRAERIAREIASGIRKPKEADHVA